MHEACASVAGGGRQIKSVKRCPREGLHEHRADVLGQATCQQSERESRPRADAERYRLALIGSTILKARLPNKSRPISGNGRTSTESAELVRVAPNIDQTGWEWWKGESVKGGVYTGYCLSTVGKRTAHYFAPAKDVRRAS